MDKLVAHLKGMSLIIGTLLFTQEVVDLLKHGGLSADSQPGRCIGYRQTLEYLRDVWKFPQGRGEGHPHPLQQVSPFTVCYYCLYISLCFSNTCLHIILA